MMMHIRTSVIPYDDGEGGMVVYRAPCVQSGVSDVVYYAGSFGSRGASVMLKNVVGAMLRYGPRLQQQWLHRSDSHWPQKHTTCPDPPAPPQHCSRRGKGRGREKQLRRRCWRVSRVERIERRAPARLTARGHPGATRCASCCTRGPAEDVAMAKSATPQMQRNTHRRPVGRSTLR